MVNRFTWTQGTTKVVGHDEPMHKLPLPLSFNAPTNVSGSVGVVAARANELLRCAAPPKSTPMDVAKPVTSDREPTARN
jgi:hypothetical protein